MISKCADNMENDVRLIRNREIEMLEVRLIRNDVRKCADNIEIEIV